MKLLFISSSIFVLSISIFYSSQLKDLFYSFTSLYNTTDIYSSSTIQNPTITTTAAETPMSSLNSIKSTMSKALSHAKIVPRRSEDRGHANHGWLNTYHSFSFANYYDPQFQHFGSLRVLNEDRVDGNSGFPTHPHRDAEIFSYILSGELTHRDSMIKKGAEGKQGDDFYRMKRGDVQFTTGGSGIAHSEQNEADKQVHFLQIWALPWARGLTPRYHTKTFSEESKRLAFLPILSPLVGGKGATPAQEKAAEATLPDTIPIHADLVMAAGIIPVDKRFKWSIGADAVTKKEHRNVYIHLPMTKNGSAKIRIDGREQVVLSEGDGAMITGVSAGDVLGIESVGEAEAEVIVLDSD
ncbi:probable protein yhhW [Rhynchosporium graminicola]|uniref:Probable protein yhhW n=1 Tax=Rhynchosporium graminicola TaxID=2792576 RepID=A0A1E1LNB4_9HELO|nr:probable protein yhhW [Rhynchosporium commune]